MRSDVPATSRPVVPLATPVGIGVVGKQWLLELPFTIPLSLNDREHWAKRARSTKAWREAALVLARHQRVPPCRRIQVELFYTPSDERPRDSLNLIPSLKAVEDGLVDAGVIPDDSTRHHTSVMPVVTEKGPLRPGRNRLWAVVTRLA